MRTKFYLDKRVAAKILSQDTNGIAPEYPIKIAINHGGSSAYINTGVSVTEACWLPKPGVGQVVNCVQRDRLNIAITEKKLAVDKILEDLRLKGALHGATASQMKALVEKRLEVEAYGTDNGEIPVIVCMENYARTKTRRGTVQVYTATIEKLRSYADFSDKTTFFSITPAWLLGFEAFLATTSPSANARGIHLRNIRRVFNFALDNGYTKAPYPFKSFKIKKAPTKDRSMTPQELRQLLSAPCNATARKYRDIFFLSFYLCGMNLEDLLDIHAIKGGRIEKLRIKTGQPLTIRVEPEASEIINKYRGTDRLLHISEGNNYKNLQHRINNYLKQIGKTYNPHTKVWEGEALFPDISLYWARYSWATIAGELDIPERTAGLAMGHSTARSVTSIYMRVDMRKKIDAANRRVIDYVFGDKNL